MALKRIEQMLSRVGEGEAIDPVEPRRFLQNWLIGHTAREDARFAAFLRGHPSHAQAGRVQTERAQAGRAAA